MIMMMWMVSGMVVLRETDFYSSTQLGWIAVAFCVSCTGIFILTKKIKNQRTQKKLEAN